MTARITVNGVTLDLDDVFEQITPKQLAAEIDERASLGCPDTLSALEKWAEEHGDDLFSADDGPFDRLSDWDLSDLRRAVLLDDGRRAIDVLKRALAHA